MNFNEFCDTEKDKEFAQYNDKFKNFNENLRKNNQKIEINGKNKEFFLNHSDAESESLKQNFNEDELKQKIEKYKNMTQSELMNELVKEAGKQKQNGNLDNKKLDEIKNSMSQFMTDEEMKRLEELIKILR